MTIESISDRQSARNELISSLLARCPMNVDAIGNQRNFIMDSLLDALFEAQRKSPPDRMGDNATKDFILRHVFGIAAELIANQVDLALDQWVTIRQLLQKQDTIVGHGGVAIEEVIVPLVKFERRTR